MNEQSLKQFCHRCKTGFPNDFIWQSVRRYWLICEKCSGELHGQDQPEPTRTESYITSGFHQLEAS